MHILKRLSSWVVSLPPCPRKHIKQTHVGKWGLRIPVRGTCLIDKSRDFLDYFPNPSRTQGTLTSYAASIGERYLGSRKHRDLALRIWMGWVQVYRVAMMEIFLREFLQQASWKARRTETLPTEPQRPSRPDRMPKPEESAKRRQ